MARPIKETPILFGEEARMLQEEMKHPQKDTPEEMARIQRDYAYIMSIFKDQPKDGQKLQS